MDSCASTDAASGTYEDMVWDRGPEVLTPACKHCQSAERYVVGDFPATTHRLTCPDNHTPSRQCIENDQREIVMDFSLSA